MHTKYRDLLSSAFITRAETVKTWQEKEVKLNSDFIQG